MQTLDNLKQTAESKLTYKQLPQVVALLVDDMIKLNVKIQELCQLTKEPEDHWLNMDELREYLPDHPAAQTIYGWTSCRFIPFHKKGKRLQFLKSEIDCWLKAEKRKTIKELQDETAHLRRKR